MPFELNMKPCYRCLVLGILVSGMFVAAVAGYPLVMKLGQTLGMPTDPRSPLNARIGMWLLLALVSFIVWMTLCTAAILASITGFIAVTNRWTWNRAWDAVTKENHYPPHWYRTESAPTTAADPGIRLEDSNPEKINVKR